MRLLTWRLLSVWTVRVHESSVQSSVIRGLLARGLTSDVSEVDGLSVGVEQLDDGVVIILHSAADGGRFALNHCHVVGRQVLVLCCKTQRGTFGWKREKYILPRSGSRN